MNQQNAFARWQVGNATGGSLGCEAQRVTVAREVLEEFERLANRARSLAEMVNDKLSPVMRPECPETCNERKDPQYPPLFNALYISGCGIRSALDVIEQAMARTEL